MSLMEFRHLHYLSDPHWHLAELLDFVPFSVIISVGIKVSWARD